MPADLRRFYLTGQLSNLSSTSSELLLPVPFDSKLVRVLSVVDDVLADSANIRVNVGNVAALDLLVAAAGAEGDVDSGEPVSTQLQVECGPNRVAKHVKAFVQEASATAANAGLTFVFER